MPSRDPMHLHPELRILHARWLETCGVRGIDVLTTCTYRSQAEQDILYAQGRTTPGKRVTWTRTSRHSETVNGYPASTAWDFVVLVAGKAVWNAKHPHWAMAGKVAEELGLDWGGAWAKNKDYPHIQMVRR